MSATSTETNAVAAVVDLLDNADRAIWPNDPPEVYRMEGVTEKDRRNRSETTIYVYNPSESDIQPFDAEYSRRIDEDGIDIVVMGNDADDVQNVREVVGDFFDEYARDNYDQTEFHSLQPVNRQDISDEQSARQTSHAVGTVSLEVTDNQATGL